jgi:hypothetical protein
MSIGYTCQYHNCAVPNGAECKFCLEERAKLPPVESMTMNERETEFNYWLDRNQITVDWDTFKGRLDELLGRDIFTHELGTSGLPFLRAEMAGKKPHPQTLEETYGGIDPAKVLVFDLRSPDDAPPSLN